MDRTSGDTPLTGSTLMRHTPSTLKAMELNDISMVTAFPLDFGLISVLL